MRAGAKFTLGDFPLAIASGITPGTFLITCRTRTVFWVATGISKSWNEFDPAKVKALANAMRRAT